MFKLAVLAAALAAAPVAFGQTTSGIPECIVTCSTQAISGTDCTGVTDLACLCNSDAFQTAAAACITQQCPDLLEQAITIQTQQCAAAGTGSGTGTASETGSGSSSAAGTGSTSAIGSLTSHASSSHASSSSASASASSTPNAGFQSASVASGAALAFFGA
ncbi:hypothetical protein FRB91_003817, partial [Serendipita sp. 411]